MVSNVYTSDAKAHFEIAQGLLLFASWLWRKEVNKRVWGIVLNVLHLANVALSCFQKKRFVCFRPPSPTLLTPLYISSKNELDSMIVQGKQIVATCYTLINGRAKQQ